jgi:hypothetical protein
MSTDKLVFENVQPFKRSANCPAAGAQTFFRSPDYYCDCSGTYIEQLDFQFVRFKNWRANLRVRVILKYWIGYPLGDGDPSGDDEVQLDGSDQQRNHRLPQPVMADQNTMIRVSLSVNCEDTNKPNLDGVECEFALVLWYSSAPPKLKTTQNY